MNQLIENIKLNSTPIGGNFTGLGAPFVNSLDPVLQHRIVSKKLSKWVLTNKGCLISCQLTESWGRSRANSGLFEFFIFDDFNQSSSLKWMLVSLAYNIGLIQGLLEYTAQFLAEQSQFSLDVVDAEQSFEELLVTDLMLPRICQTLREMANQVDSEQACFEKVLSQSLQVMTQLHVSKKHIFKTLFEAGFDREYWQ